MIRIYLGYNMKYVTDSTVTILDKSNTRIIYPV